jgi:predicted ribosomally synthesized peptide with SipW-like signal peptide
MKRSKIVLGIIAAALALSLAIGGTLMLFTANTETATNVVTLGKARIQIGEKNNNDSDYTYIDASHRFPPIFGSSSGFTGNAVPKDTLNKSVKILNTGNVPVYVAVVAKLRVPDKSAGTHPKYLPLGSVGDTTSSNTLIGWLSDYSNKAKVNALLAGVNINGDYWKGVETGDPTNWKFFLGSDNVGTEPVGTAAGAIFGAWVYAYNGTYSALTPGSDTYAVFDTITLPDFGNEFENWELELDLTGYAVQSGNVSNVFNGTTVNINSTDEAFVALKAVLPSITLIP